MSFSAPASALHSPNLIRLKVPDYFKEYIDLEARVTQCFRVKKPTLAKQLLEQTSFEKYPLDCRIRLYNLLSITHLYLEEWDAAQKAAAAGLALNPQEENEKAPLLFHQAISLHHLGLKQFADQKFAEVLSMQDLHSGLKKQFQAGMSQGLQ